MMTRAARSDAHKPESPCWRVIGASVQGSSHRKLEMPCQDAHAYRVLPGGELVAAVADGAGSAARADEGAQAAAAVALDALSLAIGKGCPASHDGWLSLMRSVFSQAQQALGWLAGLSGERLREYATTLTCVAAAGPWLVSGQIGDGAVAAMDASGRYYLASSSQRGEYANETHFLTQEDALQRVEVRVLAESPQAVAVMSDGLTRLALSLSANQPHPPFFQPLFAFVAAESNLTLASERLAGFLNSERVHARTDDDKTLVLAVRAKR